jgi:sec-independent protein translocase protein TatB
VFGMGWPEILMIGVVGVIVFGPDKLPEIAKQAGGFIRTLRRMAENAKNDLGREIGEDFSGLQLRDLDPRELVRRNILDAGDDAATPRPATRELRPDERPPFDPDAT